MLKQTDEIKSPRKAYGEALVEIGSKNKNVVVLDADLSCSTQTCMFRNAYPERFFNIGIAEQDLMGTAAGLALEGKTPFASTFAMFATARCLDQVRHAICYQNLDVKIVATHGGITVGEDGATHQALEDVSFMRSLPNMTVVVPADYTEVKQAIKFASEHKGPMYIRIARSNLKTIFDKNSYKFSVKPVLIKEGQDLTLITNGETLNEVILASNILEKEGIHADILHIPVVKPIGKDEIIKSAKKTKNVVTIENHSITGGLGSAVCEVLSENLPTKVLRIGTKDVFGQSGEQRALLEYYGLTSDKIYNQIKEYLK